MREAERTIVVVGAGGHAKVVIECLRFAGWKVVGCTDSDPEAQTCAGVPVIGSDDILERLRKTGVKSAFCALGSNALRQSIAGKLLEIGFDLPSVAGPGTLISPTARLGNGVAILPGAVVNVESFVEDFAIINTNANVDHDCVIGRAVHIGPGASLAGEVRVGDRSFVATGSSIIPRRIIGADCLIGAGSVVVRDVPNGAVAFGNPARIQRKR